MEPGGLDALPTRQTVADCSPRRPRVSNRTIARRLRINPITVARWRSRFLLLGTGGIRQEAPRLGSPPPLPRELVRRILDKTLFERPPGKSRWSTRSLGRAVGVSHSAVRRIWKAYSVHPSRSRVATLVRDPRFRPRSIDLVGVYVNPPQKAVAISLRDAGRDRPAEPLERHDSPATGIDVNERSWMDDLVTTLNLLDHAELKGSARRLLDQDFLSFLQSIRERRSGPEHIQLLAESAGPAPPISLVRWLSRHPEFSARVEVGNASLRQIVVEWFGDASARRPADLPPASLRDCAQRSSDGCERWATRLDRSPGPESRVSTPSGPMVH